MAATWRSGAAWRSSMSWRGVSSGAVTLVIADATMAQSADGLVLTQHNVLVVADAAHAHAADNLTLTAYAPGASSLTIQDSTHDQTAENVTLTQHNVLAVDGATHAHTADNVVLTAYSPFLVIADSTHAHSAGNVDLTQHNVLSIDSAYHLHTADGVRFTMPVILLRTPTSEGPAYYNMPFAYMSSSPIGRAMLVSGSTVVLVTDPTQEQLDAVDRYYLGGHDHYLEQAEADVLIAAGYGDYITTGA